MKIKRFLSLLLAGALTASLTACSNEDDYMSVVDGFFTSIEEKDSELYMECIHSIVLENEKESFDLSDSDHKQAYDEYIVKFYDAFAEKFGDDFTLSYKSTDERAIDDEKIKDWDIDLGILWVENDLEVTDGYNVTIDLTAKGSKGEETEEVTFTLLKINDEWCYVDYKMSMVTVETE